MVWLKELRLSSNPFPAGPIPSWIGDMSGLHTLKIGGNNFTGTIPSSLGNLHNLVYLELSGNQLTGGLEGLKGCTSMTALDLLSNQFNDLSADLSAMTQLGYLGLSNNQFHGPIPEWFGHLPALYQLYMNGNQFTSLPSSFKNLISLQYVYLQDNQFKGNLPDVSHMTNLKFVNVARNQFTGSLPASFSIPNIEFFDASLNQLTGPFPSISNWTNITSLSITGNQFSGAFPSATGLNKLTFLEATSNQFTSFPTSLLRLPLITYVSFQGNQVTKIDNLEAEVSANSLNPPSSLGILFIDHNRLDFKTIGTLTTLGFPLFSFPQNEIADVKEIGFNVNSSFSIPSRPLQSTTTISWEKKMGGTWSDVTASTEDATHKNFQRSSAIPTDAGTYRWKMTDTQFAGEVINSGPIELKTNTQIAIETYAFLYKYDARKRMTHKKVPGADWIYMVYDDRDRLVMSQDGEQRKSKKWTYTKYDALNRPIVTGLYTHTSTVDQAGMSALISTTNFYETFDVSLINSYGYTSTVFSSNNFNQSNFELLTVTYYDNYDFKGLSTITNPLNNYAPGQLDPQPSLTGTYPQETQANTKVIGFVTGALVKALQSNTYLLSVSYYDDKYRVIQTVSDNALGGKDQSTNIYDFTGKILASRTSHNLPSMNKFTTRTFTYDHAGRLLTTKHSIDGATPVILAKNEYNELGQLVDKKLHSTQQNGSDAKQSIDYRYNIRGWLTSINAADLSSTTNTSINDDSDITKKDLFGMELAYEKPVSTLTTTDDVQFNGNISAIMYSNNLSLGAVKSNGYKYTYDPMNRLSSSNFREKQNNTWNLSSYLSGTTPIGKEAFSETGFDYDLNGNIMKLNRSGAATASNTSMDQLGYTYNGNQLLHVDYAGDKTKGFIDGNTTGDDYSYDANGNMIVDKNKTITAITYNHLNLPDKVTKSSGEYITYTYDATGRKLSQSVFDASDKLKKKSDYAGEYFYENDTLKFINHEEGRVVLVKEGQPIAPEYQYHLKDHLGNVRTTFTTKEETEDTKATLETTSQATERSQYVNYDEARTVNSYLFDHTNNANDPASVPQGIVGAGDGNAIAFGGYAVRLTGTDKERIGLIRSLSVMPGDKVDVEVWAKYIDPNASNTPNLTALMNGVKGNGSGLVANTVVDGLSYQLAAGTVLPFVDALIRPAGSNTIPRAYLNWLVFNREGVPDLSKSNFRRISENGREDGTNKAHELLKPANTIEIAEPGYVYIWLSNDAQTVQEQMEVYFDDFKVTHTKSPIVQQDSYYPFGLTFDSYSRENSVTNQYLYNGKENQEELTLSIYDYGARMYDPTLGRWWSIDPLSDLSRRWSPYTYCYNNPLIFVDPDGMFADYYSKDGGYSFSDGKNDGKLYVVNTDSKKLKQIHKANDKDAASTLSILNTNETTISKLPSFGSREKISEAVGRMEKPTSADSKGGRHEEGGIIGTDKQGNESVVNAKSGPLMQVNGATFDPMKSENADDKSNLKSVDGTFHVHPSGEATDSKSGGTFGIDPNVSKGDKTYLEGKSQITGNSYLLNPANNKVHIYNSGGVITTFPLDKFRTVKPK